MTSEKGLLINIEGELRESELEYKWATFVYLFWMTHGLEHKAFPIKIKYVET